MYKASQWKVKKKRRQKKKKVSGEGKTRQQRLEGDAGSRKDACVGEGVCWWVYFSSDKGEETDLEGLLQFCPLR